MSELIFKENSSTPATPAASYVKFYAKSDGNLYTLNDAGTELPVAGQKDPESKSIIIENPSNSEDLSFFFTDVAITVLKMRAILTGSSTPSVTWTVRHGTDRSAAGAEVVTGGSTTTDTTTGSDITSFDDATIVANSHVWIETTAESGTVDSIIVTVFYSED